MAKMEKILQDSGILVQPYWRSTFRHMTPDVKGLDAPDLRDPPREHLARCGLTAAARTRPGAGAAADRLRARRAGMLALPARRHRRDAADGALPDADRLQPGQPQAEPREARQGADRQPHHRAAGRGLARPERLQPAASSSATASGSAARSRGDFGHSTPLQRAGRRGALAAAVADRQADVLGDGGDGPRRRCSSASSRGCARARRTTGSLSTVAIATTSTPEYVSGVVLTVIFASQMVGPAMVFRLGHLGGR